MTKIYGEVYGCTANKADHEIMMGLLRNSGMEIVDSPEKSDINLITTCTVKSQTAARMVFKSRELTKHNKPLIVGGCLPKIEKERHMIERITPNASFIGPDSITKIVDVAHDALNGRKALVLDRVREDKANLPHIRTNPVIDIVEINSGCLSNCTFCGTKLARGNIYSYRPHLIREQIRQAVFGGCKEIWLTSQDSSAYGRDIGTNLVELLESITRIEGDFFVRVGMMNPLHFKKVEIKDLIRVFRDDKIFKFLHLCVQSGSNNVLKIMGRGYAVEDFIRYADEFRKEIPELTLMTDVIVGHPGETEDDFNQTIKLIEKLEPDIVNISRFGSRPGTAASKMKQLSTTVINRRSKKLSTIVRSISHEKNKKWLGWEGKVIITNSVGNVSIGSNYAYKPITIKGKIAWGSIVQVKIKEIKDNFIIGEIR